MNVQANSQTAFLPVLKNKIYSNQQGFNFPFSERRALLVLIDALLVALSVGGALLLWQRAADWPFDIAQIGARWYWFPIMLGGWWTLAWLNDLYDIPPSNDKVGSAVRVVSVGALILIIYLAVFFLAPTLPHLFFIYFLLIALPTLTLWRWTYARVSNTPPFRHRVLIIGGEEESGQFIASALKQQPTHYQVLGYADLSYLLRERRIHEIVVATKHELENDLLRLLIDCQAQGVRVSRMPDLYEKLHRSTPIQHIDNGWALDAMQNLPVLSPLQISVKRLLDLVLGLAGLPVSILVLPVVALAIRLDSPGPIFYRQARCGRAGKVFSIIKFRTMYSDAEKDGRPRWAMKDDTRITRVGRFLRKTRLDELPQVLNVLRGEMSVIGPRPERPEFVEELQQVIPFYRTRLVAKPGLTGWAQIHYPYGNTVEDALIKLQYDFYYLRHWSLWLDLYVVFRTFGVMFKFKGT